MPVKKNHNNDDKGSCLPYSLFPVLNKSDEFSDDMTLRLKILLLWHMVPRLSPGCLLSIIGKSPLRKQVIIRPKYL